MTWQLRQGVRFWTGALAPNDQRHGTVAGYKAHRNAGETPCWACLDAWNSDQRIRYAAAPHRYHPGYRDRDRAARSTAPAPSLEDFARSRVACETCGAPPGRTCTTVTGQPGRAHASRRRAARPCWRARMLIADPARRIAA